MAYGQKYSVLFATRANKDVELKIWQDSYVGAILDLQGVDVSLQYIPSSDDPYEPIIASQLAVTIDFTDDLSDIINFTNINDRFTYVEMYVNSIIEWVGFVINDDVQISYSTGRKIATFNATDGLGMLKDVKFVSENQNFGVNDIILLKDIFRACFNSIGFKNNRNYITMCSYYSVGMYTRATYSYADPFDQACLNYRSLLEDEYNYTNCLDIISNIAKSFGCRIFQAKAKWWIVSINEFATINAYYSEYAPTGLRVNNGDGNIINTSSIIQPYVGNTSGLYFIDNSQLKIIKKGFFKIIAEGNVEIAENYISNGNLQDNNGTDATFWTRTVTGDGACVLMQSVSLDSYYFQLTTVPGGPAGTAEVKVVAGANPYVTSGDSLQLNVIIGAASTNIPVGFIEIKIDTGSTIYYLDDNAKWQTSANAYTVYNPKTTGPSEDFVLDLKTEIFPGNGTLSFRYYISEGINILTLANFVLKIKSSISAYNLTATLVDNKQYTKTIELPYGSTGSQSNYPSAKGALVLLDKSIAAAWYRYLIDPPSEFYTLSELVVQQYMNTYGLNIINVDCNLSEFYTSNTNHRTLNASKLIFATDTDPASINISSKSFMLGNATISYPSNTASATLLQISNTEIVCTRVNKYIPQTSTF
jgi:hypothetical protein